MISPFLPKKKKETFRSIIKGEINVEGNLVHIRIKYLNFVFFFIECDIKM